MCQTRRQQMWKQKDLQSVQGILEDFKRDIFNELKAVENRSPTWTGIR